MSEYETLIVAPLQFLNVFVLFKCSHLYFGHCILSLFRRHLLMTVSMVVDVFLESF